MKNISKQPGPSRRSRLRGLKPRGFPVLLLILFLSSIAAWCQTTASVSISAGSTMAPVGPEAYGIDTAVYDGYLTSAGVSTLLTQAGINAIRYPGGSYGDIFNFISGTDQTVQPGAYMASNVTFNYFMTDTVLPEGGKALITVNYGSNLTDNGGGEPSEAASWVQYANVTNNYGVVYWEIGNEIYGNGYYGTNLDWEEDLHDPDTVAADRVGNAALSPTAYGTNAAAFVTAMKAVDPSIKCGVFVNAATYYPAWDQDVLTAISSALKNTGYNLDFVIVHWYPSGTDAQVLAAQYGPNGIAANVAQIRSDIANYYTLSNGNNLEIIVSETGSGSVGGIVPALFATDDDLTWFENTATNVEYQELHNGFLTNAGPGVPEGPWYGTQFASDLARPGDTMVGAASTNPLLRVHAVKRTDGNLAVVLINQDPSNNTTATVNVSNATLGTSGTEYTLGTANFGGNDTATTGVGQSTVGGLGNTFTVTVPAYTEIGYVIPASGIKAAATVTSINPTYGLVGTAVPITILGTGFGASQGSSTVTAGGKAATVSSWSNTSINATVPGTLAAGAANVIVNVNGAGSNAAVFTVNSGTGAATALTPYAQVNAAAWNQSNYVSANPGDTVNLGPQAADGGYGQWSWTGPNGFTSNQRGINNIPLIPGTDDYTVTYTNTLSVQSSVTFIITVSGPSFSIYSQASLSVAQGGVSGPDYVTINDAGGFTGSVTLSASGLPSGVTANFATNPTTAQSVLTLSATQTAAPGTYTITINGTSGALVESTTFVLTVTGTTPPPPTFTLSPSAATLSVTQGSSATDTIKVTDVSGFTGSVTLSASGLPSGVTAGFATNPTTGSSVLTLSASSSAAAGSSTITITGTSGTQTASTTLALTITPASTGSFSLKPTAATLSIAQGASGTDAITVIDVTPFAGNVTLAASGLPSGVTASFATNPTSATSLLTLTASGTATTGTSAVTISGTSGTLSASTPITLTVTPAGCTQTAITPYLQVNGGAWQQTNVATVTATTATVNLGPQPTSGGTWSWAGPNGFTSTTRQINAIKLSAGANLYTATYTNAAGCKSTEPFTITAPNGTGSFTLAPSPATLSVTQGSSVTDTITVTDISPFAGSVTLAASALPSGVTATFGTNPATGSSILTLTASATATTGNSTVTITGTSGTLTASTSIALTVSTKVVQPLQLSVSAPTLSITQGSSGTDTVTVASGFTGSVTLAASGLPSGVTASFATNPTNATSVLTLTASAAAATGTSTVTITGVSGASTATTTIALTVNQKTTGSACTVDYTITPQNSTAFGAAITIVNNGSTALSSWTLTWSFANGQTVSSLWNGNVIQSGANVTVTNQSYNGSIAAGGSLTGVGFNGTWNGVTNAIPASFSLNGTACTVN